VTAPALNWRHTRKRLWRTTDGRYTVVKVKMPSDVPHETFRYVARAIDPAMRQQFPNTVGFPIGIDQPSLAGAQRHAEQHAHCRICAKACRDCATACDDAMDSLRGDRQVPRH
jgi:hypothetical protein